MRIRLVSSVILTLCIACGVVAGQASTEQGLTTNLVEILGYVDRFAKTLNIDLPSPLTTNDVTQFLPVGIGGVAGVRISRRYHFVFNARYRFIDGFTDYRYSMHVLWRADSIELLIRPSKISKDQALELARTYLAKLGYSETNLPPLLPPEIHQWTWEPEGVPRKELLPFFNIVWKLKNDPDDKFCMIEIDGLHEKVRSFYIENMYLTHKGK